MTRACALCALPEGESGRIMLMTAAFVAFTLGLVIVVVSVTQVHLDRKRLLDLADATALAAADEVVATSVYDGLDGTPASTGGARLDPDDVETAAAAYLAAYAGSSTLTDVRLVEAGTPDGRSARVVLTARTWPAIVSPVTRGWSDGIDLTAVAAARAW
ncbi:Putative Flp pilus-assembly TadE/G-like [Paraoerskovia marina]|uniref:Putative Flp pilus-assembly TadE/G-like n=1 Tax=Paraoerskovia marina TaxID=545619 RepID=A0A1H1UGS0_9CELL|nr:pilus assembly protein TadG-related protein [Paraoerskovia marina]SDS71734.1 Putative Flp pilus-assembly TadE/G-like [Paraoerskovia marina]